jgi:hypothetical protein
MEKFLENLTLGNSLIIGALILLVLFEIFLRLKKKQIRSKYKYNKKHVEDFEDMEKIWIEYYREDQKIFSARIVGILFILAIIIISLDIKTFSVLAIVAGTIIIVLRDYIFSFISFFYVISIYKIGDDIRNNEILGEIVRINPLYVAVAGKDEDGEYNGKLHRIPNMFFASQKTEIQELKIEDYRRVVLTAIYTRERFEDNFENWLGKVRNFLEETLPSRSWERVGHFKGYLGIKYKMNYDYNDKGEVIVRISFIARYPKNTEQKERIIEFIESLRKVDSGKASMI